MASASCARNECLESLLSRRTVLVQSKRKRFWNFAIVSRIFEGSRRLRPLYRLPLHLPGIIPSSLHSRSIVPGRFSRVGSDGQSHGYPSSFSGRLVTIRGYLHLCAASISRESSEIRFCTAPAKQIELSNQNAGTVKLSGVWSRELDWAGDGMKITMGYHPKTLWAQLIGTASSIFGIHLYWSGCECQIRWVATSHTLAVSRYPDILQGQW
jgi:hypothetical protein